MMILLVDFRSKEILSRFFIVILIHTNVLNRTYTL